MNILWNIGTDDDEFLNDIQYLQENPKDQYVDYVANCLEDMITGENELEAIESLIRRYRAEIRNQ